MIVKGQLSLTNAERSWALGLAGLICIRCSQLLGGRSFCAREDRAGSFELREGMFGILPMLSFIFN